MVAVGRIRFLKLILLIVVLNVVARGHVVKRDVNTNGWTSRIVAETTTSSTNFPTQNAATSKAEPDSTASTDIPQRSSVTITTDTITTVGIPPEEDELSHDKDDSTGKWCLKIITEAHGNDPVFGSNESSSHKSEDCPKSERHPFTLDHESKCGIFGTSSHNKALLYVSVSHSSKMETQLCVEFAQEYNTYVEKVTITSDRFQAKLLANPGGSEVISESKHCCSCKYTVVVTCKTGKGVPKIIESERRQFPIKLVKISADVIYWSYPLEGLQCIKAFRIDLIVSTKHQHNKTSYVVSNWQDTGGNFNFTLRDPRIICIPKNVTITPIFNDYKEGIPVTEYSEVDLSINPILKNSSVNFTQYGWGTSELFEKCAEEIRVLNGNTTALTLKKHGDPPKLRTRATFKNLDACRLHTFTFEVIDLDGTVRSQVVSNITIMDVVGASVVDLNAIENHTGIAWKPPKAMAYCIKSYLVEAQYLESGQKINTSTQMSVRRVQMSDEIIKFHLNATGICSLASISVIPISLNGSRWTTSTLNISSMGSVKNLQIHPLSSSVINITWDPPQIFPDCVAYYLVFSQKTPNSSRNITSLWIKIDNLIPCLNYSFAVVPVNQYGLNYSSAMASISMPEERIPSVQHVMSQGDVIQWSLSPQSFSCIKEFQVILRTKDGRLLDNKTISMRSRPAKSEPNTYSFRKTSDTPCALLKYSITPVSLSWKLGYSYEQITPRPKPGPVRDVTTDTSVERQVTISWMKPELFPECVSSYRISYDDRNVTALSNETFVTIQNLNSCMEYNFTIATVDFSGEDAASVVVNATVKEEKLSGVQDLELTEVTDQRSLTASWKPPENGTYCVAYYRYVAWATGEGDLPAQSSNSTNDMRLTIPEVFACTMYYVQIIPVSKGNNDGNNEIAEILTKERVILRYHIDPVRIKNQMAQSLELQTALSKDSNNNCDLKSVRFTCTTNNVPEGEDPKVIAGEAEISDPKSIFSAVVTPLQPYTEYNCTAAVLNIAGWSDETALVSFMTGEHFPEQPENLQLKGGARMIALSWNAPKVKNGIISRYRVHIRSEGARYPTPSYCPLPDLYNVTSDLHEDDENVRSKSWNNDELNHTIDELIPYTDYVVQVAAATKAGLGPYTEMVSVSTLPEQPEPVYEFSEYNVTSPEIDKPYNSTVHISWKIPCHLYGRLRNFTGQFIGYKGAFEHTFGWTRTIDSSEEILETYSLTEERLEPELQYNVSITVSVEDVANHSDAKFLSFSSPAGIPNITNEINWGAVDVMGAPNPTRTARIWISDFIFQSNVGSITGVALLVSERHCQADPVPIRNISIEWPNVLSWKAAVQRPCIPQYQTTPKQWNPVVNSKLVGRQTPEIEYIIGKEQCEEVQEYCNGALKPGTEYALIVRIFTNSGYSDSAIQYFQTDSLIQLTVIVTSIFVCLLLAFAMGLVILWRTQKLTLSPLTAVRSPNEEPSDIPLKSFSGIYEELIQSNREKINKEYQAINFFSEQLISEKVTFFVAKENARKNRYQGIFPYDGNRVLLDVDDIFVEEDEDSNDYINASFIDGYKYQREYIATQGPKKETCFDFWRMILQYEVESIVMLTQTVENDRIKCYQYFPRFNQTMHFRDVSVKCTQELNMGFYQKRLFVVKGDKMSKAVFHYHFLTWPDHGCPSNASDLIKFIKIIRSERKNLALPVVVHCSAGVGRTGTLIALDIILQRIQQEKKINIYDTVKQLRTQRVKMVQTSEQYAFLYHACLEHTTRNNRKKPKTSTEEISTSARSSPVTPSSVAPKNGRRPMINIKFPKYVHSGISNVKSYAPDDVESKT